MVNKMVLLISRNPSPIMDWIVEWAEIILSYPESKSISPEGRLKETLQQIRPDLESAVRRSNSSDVKRTCLSLAGFLARMMADLRQRPSLIEDSQFRMLYGIMSVLTTLFSEINGDCRKVFNDVSELQSQGLF